MKMDRNSVATMRLQYKASAGDHSGKPLTIVNAFIERGDFEGEPDVSDVYHVRVMKGDVIRDFWNVPYLTAALLLMAAEVDNLYNERD
jgi:hypothetical protein